MIGCKFPTAVTIHIKGREFNTVALSPSHYWDILNYEKAKEIDASV